MPRRIPDYPDVYSYWNSIASIGAYLSAAGVLLFVFIILKAFRSGEEAEANPWGVGATTLEWTVSSPPPFHSFEDPPVITAAGE